MQLSLSTEIFENGFLTSSPQLMFANMEVRVDPEAREVDQQITYLYNLRLGRSVASFGTMCVNHICRVNCG